MAGGGNSGGNASPRPRLRFAPSPTGQLHLGGAASALLNHNLARLWGGRFLIRIEDTDLGRCRQGFVDGILEDLAWLGLVSDEPVIRQSHHFDRYVSALEVLRAKGLVYPCFATRAEIAAAVSGKPGHPRDPDGAPVYPGLHKNLPAAEVAARRKAGETMAWRLDMAKALELVPGLIEATALTYRRLQPDGGLIDTRCAPERWGDFVVARKDTPTSYHLAVVVDDAFQGITHVVRGQDLEASTDVHRLLQTLLGLPQPVYLHHALILDADGRKLSKSARDTALGDLRAAGWRPQDVRRRVAGVLAPWIDV